MNTLNTRDYLRAQDVTRWHTLSMRREQSVAEHSYGVAILAMEILRVRSPGAATDTHNALVVRALLHDVHECLTGDAPAPMKQQGGVRAEYRMVENEYWHRYPHWVAVPGANQSRKIQEVVRGADLLEAILWLEKYGNHLEDAGSYERQSLDDMLVRMRGLHESVQTVYNEYHDTPSTKLPVPWLKENPEKPG